MPRLTPLAFQVSFKTPSWLLSCRSVVAEVLNCDCMLETPGKFTEHRCLSFIAILIYLGEIKKTDFFNAAMDASDIEISS